MSKFGFDKTLKDFERVKRDLPPKLAAQAENYFSDSFKKQGFDGDTWKEVQRRIPGTRAYKYPKRKGLTRRKKPILVGRGILRRAVANSVRNKTFKKIKLVVDLPYAEAHNEGAGNMPERTYMRHTEELGSMQRKLIEQETGKIF